VAGISAKIALLLPDMRGGGAERVALQLIMDFQSSGASIDLLLLQKRGELLERVPSGVRIIDLGAPRIRSALMPLIRYLRSEKPEGLLALMWPLTILAVLAFRISRSQTRLVLADHTTLSLHYGYFSGAIRRAMAASIRFLYPLAGARVAVSGGVADDLARLSGISRESISVVYNPVPAPPQINEAARAEADAAWGGPGKRLITIGNLKPEKKHTLLIRAFARVASETSAKLMILGEGAMRSELERLADELGLSRHVLLPGFAPDPWPLLSSADLFALSSDYEGYPLVLIEAMRCGVPVVSTDCESGPREILDGGRYGALTPVGDEVALARALAEALEQPHDPERLRTRAEVISGSDTSQKYLSLLLGGARGSVRR
jgi:glycosyltransferase involved in cell wall biosynthesis